METSARVYGDLVVFDLDNTIYDFSAIFSPAFRGMTNAISRKTGFSKDCVAESIKKVLENRLSLEYPFLSEEMDIFKDMAELEKREIGTLAQIVFNKTKRKRLRGSIYPGVAEDLALLRNAGCTLVALTNAPLYQSFKRVDAFGLTDFFHGLVAAENFVVPPGIKLRARSDPWASKPKLLTMTFSVHERKPSKRPFELVIEAFPSHSRRYMVGDNLVTDLKSAAKCGFTTVWARYGTLMEEKNQLTMVGLTPSQVRNTWYGAEKFTPDYTIDSFSEVTKILRVMRQGELF